MENAGGEKPQVVYQTTTLTPGIVETMIMDDSPEMIFNNFWAFLGIDIPIADIQPWDFENVLDRVQQICIEILEEYPEEMWDKLEIIQYKYTPLNNGKYMKEKIRSFKVMQILTMLETKAYLKMCRARGGLTIRALTENRSFFREESNTPYIQMQPMQQPMSQQKRGWRPF